MNRILILLLAVITGFTYAKADFDKPDFAYPATVITDADSVLHHATGTERIKAVMQIVEAKSLVSPDSLMAMPAFIDRMAAGERNTDLRGLLLLYEADVLNRYYDNVRFKVDRLDAPATPLSADISEWTGKQLRTRVAELCDSAITILGSYMGRKLEGYADIISCPKESKPFFPTLGDFVYAQTAALCGHSGVSYRDTAMEACLPGTPSWAWWLCNSDISSKDILDYYYKYPDGITGGYLLLRAFTTPDATLYRYNDKKNAPEAVKVIQKYLNANPGGMLDEYLTSLIAKYTVPWLDYNFPAHAVPGKPIEVVLKHGYTGRITIEAYKIDNLWASPNARTASKVKSSSIDCNRSSAYAEDTVRLDLPTGNYELRAYADGTPRNTSRYYTCNLTVTPWLPLVASQDGKANRNLTALVDFTSGVPAAGVKTAFVASGKLQATASGTTGADGFVEFNLPAGGNYRRYYSKYTDAKGNSVYFNNLRANGRAGRQSEFTTGAIFIDRPAYHPGDTVRWSFVAVVKDPEKHTSRLASERRFSVRFLDANYQNFDTVKVVTDRFGRASGATAMPADRLTGRYFIQILDNDNTFASTSLMVSDFRPPVFQIDSIGVKREGNVFNITGRAMTYSGVAVDAAKIDIDIQSRPIYLRGFDDFEAVDQSYTVTTGLNGFFSLDIPADTLPHGMYICNITATDVAANTATASATFRSGKPYAIFSTINDETAFNTDSIVEAAVYAYGNGDSRATLNAVWKLTDNNKREHSGTCTITPRGTAFDWHDIPAGSYSLDIFTADNAMADTCSIDRICLYSVDKNSVPADVMLLLPENSFRYDGSSPISITVGHGSNGYIYAMGFYPDGTPVKIARDIKAGFGKIEIPIHNGEAPNISIFAIKDGKVKSEEIDFIKYNPTEKLTLKGESWRDNIVPGTPERWTLRLSDGNGTPVSGTMVATMYNHALDALTSFNWPNGLATLLRAPQASNYVSFDIESAYNNYRHLQGNFDFKILSIVRPQFIYSGSAIYDMGGIKYRKLMARSANSAGVEMMDYAAPVLEESVVTAYGSSAKPMLTGSTPGIANSRMAKAEAVEEAEESADEDIAEGAALEEDKFDFRAAETLQAFWKPEVNINEDGIATISFDVPNAIGAWTFKAAAWTHDCRATDMAATLTASKPMMVQPNLPRFLRQGDEAQVLATLYNNTDSTLVVNTVIEIFDPVENSVISTSAAVDTISAGAQTVVQVTINGIYDMSLIGYRVRSTANGFTDGEQSLIPILEASTVAIDSQIFYLTDSDKEFTTEIPAATDNKGTVALQYCQNPVWDVIKTLPGLYDSKPTSSTAAAASAYAAFTSRGLYKAFPEIRKALDLWQSTPEDSDLMSKLYKNEDIKLAALARTPFVGAANANTEQMERLALTFDPKVIERTANTAISRLEALQNADGGFAWGDWTRYSSEWATSSVLSSLGRLNRLGYYPADNSRLDRIIDKAFTYIESRITGEESASSYAYLYSLYPGRKAGSIKVQKLIDRAVQQAVAGWKKYSTSEKVRAALMLHNLGNSAVASEIMRSVAQFAVADGKQGISFPSVSYVDAYASILEAFATIDPQSDLIDGMKQWLILRTQVTSDMGSWDPLPLAAAFIATGSRWTSLPDTCTANVTVDGTALDITKVEALTGSYSLRLPSARETRTVTFTRPAGAPVSYGSVVSISAQPLDKVKAASSRYLSIDKRYLVQRDGKWVETESFGLGDRVQVQLIIKADRDMQYITVRDDRPASFQPVEQMPGWVYSGNLGAYRENSDTRTNLFVDYLPKGTYYLTYEMTAALAGTFASGTATIQSQYAPEFTARSSASRISVNK